MPDEPNYDDVVSAAMPAPKLMKVVRGSEKLKGVQPDLIEHWNKLQGEFSKAGLSPAIKSGFRTAEQQNSLHRRGYPTKGNDGYINISPHQEGRALDISFSAAQKPKGREIIAAYARANGLHVPSDEPWHLAMPKAQKAEDDYADVIGAAVPTATKSAPVDSDSYDDVIAAATPKRTPVMSALDKLTADVNRRTGAIKPQRVGMGDVQQASRETGRPSTVNQTSDELRVMKGEQPVDRVGNRAPLGSPQRNAEERLAGMQNRDTAQAQARAERDKPEVERLTPLYQELIRKAAPVVGTNQATEAGAQGVSEWGKLASGLMRSADSPLGGINPLAALAAKVVSPDTVAAHSEAIRQAAEKEGANRTEAMKIAQRVVGGLVGSAPELAAMGAGIPPVAVFGAGGGLRAYGTGQPVAPAVTQGVESGLAWELPGVGKGLTEAGTKGLATGAATTGINLAAGATPKDAILGGVEAGLMRGVPEAVRLRPRGERNVTDRVSSASQAENLQPSGIETESQAGAGNAGDFATSLAPRLKVDTSTLRDIGNGYSVGIGRHEFTPSPRRTASAFKNPEGAVLVKDGKTVGVFWGDTLGISPEHRGRGLSRELINERLKLGPISEYGARTPAGAAAMKSAERFRGDQGDDIATDIRPADTETNRPTGTGARQAGRPEVVPQPQTEHHSVSQPRRARNTEHGTRGQFKAGKIEPQTPAVEPSVSPETSAQGVEQSAPSPQQNVASVPFMITRQMEADLKGRGYSQGDINKLTPQQAHDILASPQVEAPNVPEKPETIQAQLEARGYSLIPNDNPRPPLPEGYQAEQVADGVVYYDPKRIDAETIRNTPTTELLGHVEPKSEATTEAVVARKPDGTEIQASAVSPENVEKQVATTQANFPEAKVKSGGPEVAQKVIEDRLSDTTSIKNAAIEADRAAMGLPNLTPADRVTWQESIDHAQAKGLDKADAADHIADRVLAGKQKGLNDEESAGLELRIRELQNQHNELSKKIWAEKDPTKIEDLRAQASEIEDKFNKLSDATKKGGSDVARALAFRRSAINENYDLVSLKRDFKAKTGKEPTGKVLEQLEKITREHEELKTKLQGVEEENAKLRADAAIKRIRRDVSRETQRAARDAKKATLDDEAVELKNLIAQAWKKNQQQTGVQPSVFAKLDPEGEITKLVLKLARNRVQKGTITAEGLVQEVHGLLKDVVDDLSARDVREMISGYGRTPSKRSELQRQLDDLKSELYQGLSAEDIAAGVRSPRSEGPRQSEVRKLPAEGPRPSEARQSGIPLQGPKLSDIRKVPEQGPSLSEGVGRKEGPRIQDAPFVGPRTSDVNRVRAEGPRLTDVPKQGPRNTWPARQRAIEKQIADLERKIAAEDFSEKAKRGKTVLSPKAQAIADRLEAKRNEYQNLKRRHEPWNWLRNLSSIRKAGMLSGYLTHVRNIAGTGGYIGFEEARRIPSVIADAALSTVTGRRTTTLSPSAMLDGVIQAMKVGGREAKEIMKQGATREQMAQHQFQEINTGSKAINTAFNLVFRAMSASDRVFYQGSYKRNLVERAQAQAKTEARNDRSINWRERAKELADNPTKEMELDAKHDALVSTFNNNNRLSDAITRGRGALGAGGNFALDLVLPFDRTPTNVIARVIEASPAGYFKNAGQVAKSLWNRSFSPAEQRAFVQTFGRATTGTAISALGFALAAKGLLTTDDYGTTYLEFRGKKINLSAIAPLGTLLGVGAGLQKQYAKGDASKRNYAGAVTKPLADQPLLKSSSQISDIVKDPNRSFGKFAAGTASSFIPFSGAVRSLGETIDPAQKRYPDSSFKEQFQKNVPKWRESLPASHVRLLGSENSKAVKEVERLGINFKGAVRQEDETPEDFQKRQAIQNGNIRTQIENIMELPEYDKVSDEDKKAWIKQAVEFASDQTKESLPEKPEKPEQKQFPMPQAGVGFDRAYPADALARFERMSAAQRSKVVDSMSEKAWLLTHSAALSDEQKAEYKARLDKLGIVPRSSNQPKMSIGAQYKSGLNATQ